MAAEAVQSLCFRKGVFENNTFSRLQAVVELNGSSDLDSLQQQQQQLLSPACPSCPWLSSLSPELFLLLAGETLGSRLSLRSSFKCRFFYLVFVLQTLP